MCLFQIIYMYVYLLKREGGGGRSFSFGDVSGRGSFGLARFYGKASRSKRLRTSRVSPRTDFILSGNFRQIRVDSLSARARARELSKRLNELNELIEMARFKVKRFRRGGKGENRTGTVRGCFRSRGGDYAERAVYREISFSDI